MKTLAEYPPEFGSRLVRGVHQQEIAIPGREDIVARVVTCTIRGEGTQHFWYELWKTGGEKLEDCVGKYTMGGSICVQDINTAQSYIAESSIPERLRFFKKAGVESRSGYIRQLDDDGLLNPEFR